MGIPASPFGCTDLNITVSGYRLIILSSKYTRLSIDLFGGSGGVNYGFIPHHVYRDTGGFRRFLMFVERIFRKSAFISSIAIDYGYGNGDGETATFL